MRVLWSVTFALIVALLPALAVAKDGSNHAGESSKFNSGTGQGQNQQVQPLLRGNNSNDRKGGRYLAAPVKKRTVTPEKVEAGSENVRRVK